MVTIAISTVEPHQRQQRAQPRPDLRVPRAGIAAGERALDRGINNSQITIEMTTISATEIRWPTKISAPIEAGASRRCRLPQPCRAATSAMA